MSTADSMTAAIASRLRLAREQAGLTQGQVAQMLGLHRPSVSEMEAGRRKVSVEEMKRLAEIYGVSISWLSCVDSDVTNEDQARIELAARELAKLKPDDLNRLLDLLATLRG